MYGMAKSIHRDRCPSRQNRGACTGIWPRGWSKAAWIKYVYNDLNEVWLPDWVRVAIKMYE